VTNIVLPHPNEPQNGTSDFDADIVRQNIAALVAYLTAIPGENLLAQSVVEAALDPSVNPRLRNSEMFPNYVYSGGLPGGFSTFDLTIPTGTAYTTGYRHPIVAQTFTVAASKDTYFSVNKTGAVDLPQAVANGAAAPTLPSDSQWLIKVISNGSAITSIVDIRNLAPTYGSVTRRAKVNASPSAFSAETTVLTLDPVYTDGTRDVELTANFPQISSTVAGDRAHIRIKDNGTLIGDWYVGTPANGWAGTVVAELTKPAAGLHSYTVTVQRDSGTGNLTCYADPTASLSLAAKLV
jgi:hypothetical protein